MMSTLSSPGSDTSCVQESLATMSHVVDQPKMPAPPNSTQFQDIPRSGFRESSPVTRGAAYPVHAMNDPPTSPPLSYNTNPPYGIHRVDSSSVSSSQGFGWQNPAHNINPAHRTDLTSHSYGISTPPVIYPEPVFQAYTSTGPKVNDSVPDALQTSYLSASSFGVFPHGSNPVPGVGDSNGFGAVPSSVPSNMIPPVTYPSSFGSYPNALDISIPSTLATPTQPFCPAVSAPHMYPATKPFPPAPTPSRPSSKQLSQINHEELHPPTPITFPPVSYNAPSPLSYPMGLAPVGNHVIPQPVPKSSYPRQTSEVTAPVYRSPGTSATLSEWNRIKTPIGLTQEFNLFPSDSSDLAPKPAVPYPVNCDPDVLRCTLTNFPSTSKLINQCRLPLGLVMHPFRDLGRLDTITSNVIARCRSCRTYINPFVQFVDSGRRWRCPVCFLSNTVPDDLFYDPATQSYGDPSRRPEIKSATVEFIAPPEYMLRPPQPATYLFCFDVSRAAITTGYLRLACRCMLASLNRLPGDTRKQIGFITYNSSIHFYKLCGDSMKLLICPDLDEPFLPDYEGLLNHIDDSTEALSDFLSRLPDTFADTEDVGNCLGSVLQIGSKLIGRTGGRITVFNTTLPSMGAGALQLREEPSDRTSIEVKHLGPAIDFYKSFALECVTQHIAVDMFLLNSQYCDIATLSGATRFSAGTVYHYPNFYYAGDQHDSMGNTVNKTGNSVPDNPAPVQSPTVCVEAERFRRDFDRYLTRRIGFEAVMRIRCTQGISIHSFHGSCFVRSVDLIALPNVSPDAGFAVQLSLSENVDKYSSVCLQTAILYTSSRGDRRIRVHTLCLPVVHSPIEVFHGADQGAIACLVGKMAVDRALNSSLANAREALTNAIADMLVAYASITGLTGSAGASYPMACPPNLRLLALYLCGLLRFTAFKVSTPVRIDDRSAALERVKTAPPDELLTLMYPRLYAVHSLVTKPMESSGLTLAQQAATLCLSDYGDAQLDQNPHNVDRVVNEEASSDVSSTSEDEIELSCLSAQFPGQFHLSSRNVSRTGIYLLDTGELLLLLVGASENAAKDAASSWSEVLHQLLGISSPEELPIDGGPFALPRIRTSTSMDTKGSKTHNPVPVARRRLASLIEMIRRRRPTNSALCCMRHDAPAILRSRFLNAMVEDRTESAPSYREFLQMIQTAMKT